MILREDDPDGGGLLASGEEMIDQQAAPLVGGLQRSGGGDHTKFVSLSVSGQVGSRDICHSLKLIISFQFDDKKGS